MSYVYKNVLDQTRQTFQAQTRFASSRFSGIQVLGTSKIFAQPLHDLFVLPFDTLERFTPHHIMVQLNLLSVHTQRVVKIASCCVATVSYRLVALGIVLLNNILHERCVLGVKTPRSLNSSMRCAFYTWNEGRESIVFNFCWLESILEYHFALVSAEYFSKSILFEQKLFELEILIIQIVTDSNDLWNACVDCIG